MPLTIYQPGEAGIQTAADLARAVLAIAAAPADVHLKLPITFATADAAILFTIPTGLKIEIQRAYWEVTVSWTGGASSAIGVSSANANFNTKGDILGAAGGDLAATLVSTGVPYKGTLGAKYASNGMVVLVGGDTVRFDRIVSAYTVGTGFVHLSGMLID